LRSIVHSSQFRRDYKKAARQRKDMDLLREVVEVLVAGERVDARFRDHALSGNWMGYRELHLKPDWLLVYKLTTEELRLARVGSHAELFSK
jgi:mRNA interferase YafQ